MGVVNDTFPTATNLDPCFLRRVDCQSSHPAQTFSHRGPAQTIPSPAYPDTMSAPEVHQLSLGPLTGVAFGPDRTSMWLFPAVYGCCDTSGLQLTCHRGRCLPQYQ